MVMAAAMRVAAVMLVVVMLSQIVILVMVSVKLLARFIITAADPDRAFKLGRIVMVVVVVMMIIIVIIIIIVIACRVSWTMCIGICFGITRFLQQQLQQIKERPLLCE